MEKLLCGVVLLCAAQAHAQDASAPSGGYISAEFGNGHIYGGNAGRNRDMQGRAFELRFGHELQPGLFGGASPDLNTSHLLRVDVVHYNEGHPENNHRDGFAAQLVYARRLASWVTAEVLAGPYLSMNTTVLNGTQVNDSNLGLLAGVALRFPLDRTIPALHLRVGFNHVEMRDVHNSNALLIGLGREFGSAPAYAARPAQNGPVWLGGSVGNSITNMSGTHHAYGFLLEAKRYSDPWAMSGKLIFEGDDRSKVDRRGIAGQLWYVQPLTKTWAVSAGIGPYLAENERDRGYLRVHALISLQAEYALREHTHMFVSFNRVKAFREKSDRDLFHIGILQAFGN